MTSPPAAAAKALTATYLRHVTVLVRLCEARSALSPPAIGADGGGTDAAGSDSHSVKAQGRRGADGAGILCRIQVVPSQ